MKAYQVPLTNRTSKGLPIINLLKFEEGESLATIINVKSLDDPGYLIFATKKGIIKKTELVQYKNIRSTGIRAITLNSSDELIKVSLTDGTKDIIFAASNGKAIRFNEDTVRSTNRIASGVKGIKVASGERAIGLAVVNAEDDQIIIVTENGYGKRTSADDFKVKGRNGKGVKFLNMTEKVGIPVCLDTASDNEDLMVITDGGMIIRTPLSAISKIGRDAQGVRIIKVDETQKVASIAIVPHQDDEEEVVDEAVNDVDNEMKALLNSYDENNSLIDEDEEEIDEENYDDQE